MAIEKLLQELEALVESAGRLPWVGRKSIPEHKFYDLLAKIRQGLPEEVGKAAEVLRERERLINEARAQAEAIIGEARKEAARMVEESEIIKRATQSASDLMHQAEVAAESVDQSLARLRAAVEEGRRAIAPPSESAEVKESDVAEPRD